MPSRMHRHRQGTLDGEPHRRFRAVLLLCEFPRAQNRKGRGGQLPIFGRIPIWLMIEDEHTAVFAAILYGIDRSFFQSICSPAMLEATVVDKFTDWTNVGGSRCCGA